MRTHSIIFWKKLVGVPFSRTAHNEKSFRALCSFHGFSWFDLKHHRRYSIMKRNKRSISNAQGYKHGLGIDRKVSERALSSRPARRPRRRRRGRRHHRFQARRPCRRHPRRASPNPLPSPSPPSPPPNMALPRPSPSPPPSPLPLPPPTPLPPLGRPWW